MSAPDLLVTLSTDDSAHVRAHVRANAGDVALALRFVFVDSAHC